MICTAAWIVRVNRDLGDAARADALERRRAEWIAANDPTLAFANCSTTGPG